MEYGFTPNQVAHFSINSDDVERARAFYGDVFGWKFHAYGPPGFYMIEMPTPTAPLVGSLQGRRELVPGVQVRGFECTIAVADVDETAKAVVKAGGKIHMSRVTLPTIGHLIYFEDTEGNLVGAMQYDSHAE